MTTDAVNRGTVHALQTLAGLEVFEGNGWHPFVGSKIEMRQRIRRQVEANRQINRGEPHLPRHARPVPERLR